MPYLFSVGGIGNIRYLCTVKKGNKRAGGPPREKNKQYNQQKENKWKRNIIALYVSGYMIRQ